MTVKVSNNAWGTLSVGVNDTDTTILLGTAQGDRFPSLPQSINGDNEDYYYVTLIDEATNEVEIVRVIDRINDVLTVLRAQDGTRRKQFLAGSRVELRPVAALFNSKKDVVEDAAEKKALKERLDQFEEDVKTEFENVVHMGEQELTDEEMDQSRENIGAMGIDADEDVGGSKTWKKPQFFDNNIVFHQRTKTDRRSFSLIGRIADNDAWCIRGGADTLNNDPHNQPTQVDNGFLEICTADNGNEPIYISQYSSGGIPAQIDGENGGGWDEVFKTPNRRAVILDRSGNTQFPGRLNVGGAVFGSYFQATSDKRLKTEFKPIEAPADVLKGITGLSYRRLDRDLHKRFVGVIAQDVQKVLPEAVEQSGLGYLSVDYNAIVGVLVEEVKALRKELEEIKNGMQKTVQEAVPTSAKETVQEVKKPVVNRRKVAK